MSSVLQKRRKELRTELSQIEKQIYDLETTYLEETKDFGNIFTGWDAYLAPDKVKQRKNVLLEDRQFSLSSVTSPASRKEDSKKAGKATGAESGKKRKMGKDKADAADA
ncbi:histone acetyltransferase subunit NuA4-domain-containing protein [Ochromonadaceae sp. CCMP2298]|nr:histone acetyltransferase subunit NuA4-domain-containing protein [Ochromonadaceae sp. CCMP2298]|mmetsp:Transcript_10408/g.23067  ORF Transcript_10408/g.23067 Transcript_10408/m.23067 type:complete len:109 (+) Transcript_10408:151-477(+)